MQGDWQKSEISNLQYALSSITDKVGQSNFRRMFDKTRVMRMSQYQSNGDNGFDAWTTMIGNEWVVQIFSNFWKRETFLDRTFLLVHEFGHIWDARQDWRGSAAMQQVTDSSYVWGPIRGVCSPGWPYCNYAAGPEVTSGVTPPLFPPANAVEDFAQSFALYVMQDRVSNHRVYSHIYTTEQLMLRWSVIGLLLAPQ